MKKAEGNKSTLAKHLAAVLNDPNTPEGIYNALREELLDAATEARVSIDDPTTLPDTLPHVLDVLSAQGTSRSDNQPQDELQISERPQTPEQAAAALSPEQVAAIINQWTISQFSDDESIGDLLLVIRAIVFRDDLAEREHVLSAIETVLMPFSPSVSQALRSTVARRLEEVREWRVSR